ncbi:hypothetical protein [Granulicella sibirica]|uniref:General secretion pathway protein D n=1 Tax=Granulicella sibirica TaxID=2479048 RepID=A0A4Q0SYH8_9BACT|nr:hypothetical protein [Granulicella sibirica]RXH55462.1 General secretion pathway protein D [Granulicella sibirica]
MTLPSHRRSSRKARRASLAIAVAAMGLFPGDSRAQQPAAPSATAAGTPVTAPPLPEPQNRSAADAYIAGARALEHNESAVAEKHFARAVALDPANKDYALSLAVAREHHLTDLVHNAADARERGRNADAEKFLAEARILDPQNSVIAQHPVPGTPEPRHSMLDIEPRIIPGVGFTDAVVLKPDTTTKSFHIKGDRQDAIRQVMQAFGIKTDFDESAGHQNLRFDLDDTTYSQAVPILFSMSHVFAVPLDAKTVLIAKDTAENHQKFERQVEETIFVPGQTVEQMNDLGNVIRNLFDVKQLTLQQTQGSLVLRAPTDTVKAINITLADLLDGGSEVIVEMKLYSIDTSRTHDIGGQPPQFGAYNVSAAAQQLVSANQTLVNEAISQGLISATDSIVAQAFKLIASGLVSSTLLSSTIGILGGTIDPTTGAVSNEFTTTGITSSSTLTFNLALNSSDSRALEDVQARVGDRQTATFRSGMRYPITTSTYSTPSTAALSGVSVNGQSASSLLSQYLGTSSALTIPQVSYEDLGLTLKATPNVQKSGRVSMHLDLKLEALTGSALNAIPVLASRTLTSDVTVNEGETALLVSTVSKSESSAVTGLPGLTELPGFQVPTEQNVTTDSSELVLLITPHVVRHRASNLAGPRIAVNVPPSSRED